MLSSAYTFVNFCILKMIFHGLVCYWLHNPTVTMRPEKEAHGLAMTLRRCTQLWEISMLVNRHQDNKGYVRIWHSEDRASWYILITKWTRCTNFPNLFLEWNSTCFEQSLCPSSEVQHCIHSKTCVTYTYCSVYSAGLLMMDRDCSFHSKNKFEKLVHLIGFVIKSYVRSSAKTLVNSISSRCSINCNAIFPTIHWTSFQALVKNQVFTMTLILFCSWPWNYCTIIL